MATLILVRHGRSTSNTGGTLAGRLPGVRLDAAGEEQVGRIGERLAPVPIAALISSPLERCKQTAKAIAAAHPTKLRIASERGLTECDYGDWQGRLIKDLAKEPLWKTVQTQPSAAIFPGGESLVTMQSRAVAAVRRHDAAIEAELGAGAVWVAVSHGDIIKSILADALGMHLDLFQRIHVDPASVSIISYTSTRPYVLASNTHAGDLSWLRPQATKKPTKKDAKKGRTTRKADAVVGGGAGPSAPA
jgi:probable phosphomutase (TIGR03848 family)